MNIHAYILTWNEETLLPYTLRHYKEFCSKITIYDNESDDNTTKIAESWGCEVYKFSTGGCFDDLTNMRLKNQMWKPSRGECDLVIVVDCDELVTGEFDLNYTLLRPRWHEMLGFPGELPLKGRYNPFGKPQVFNPNEIHEINYGLGGHNCTPDGIVRIYDGDDLKCLHYNNLSLEWKINRYRESGKRFSEANLKNGWGNHHLWSDEKITEVYNELINNAVEL